MAAQFAFEKLEVWQKARAFNKTIYQTTSKLPYSEQGILVDQLRRAANSIPSNIAEGSGRLSPKQFIHFLSISYGSLMEMFNHLILAHDLGYISDKELAEIRIKTSEIAKMIKSLRYKLDTRP